MRFVFLPVNFLHFRSSIINYLKRQLPRDKQYIADAWLAVTRDVSRVSRANLFPLKNKAQEAEVIVWALEKLAWRKPELAAGVYTQYLNKGLFSQAQQHVALRSIALSFTLDRLPQAHEWLEKADLMMKECIENYSDETSGLFYFTSAQQKDLIARKIEIHDNVIEGTCSQH